MPTPDTTTPRPGPLSGLRVLELTSVVLGPLACQALGDLGADIIKIEPPAGDSNRQVGPRVSDDMGALFLTCNRNKRSVVLDLKREAGRDTLLRLAARADVVVHNLRPSALARLGLSAAGLRAANPRLIVCGVAGFGRHGPYAERPAYDDLIQAACGLAALEGRGREGSAYVPTIVADKTTALEVVNAVLAALVHRERTGEGQEVHVPMFESMVAWVMAEHLFARSFEPPRGPAGYTRLLSAHRRPYRTRDGELAVLPYLDEHWATFCALAGRGDLARNPRYATLAARAAHIDDVYRETAAIMATRTTAEWIAALEPTPVPFTPVSSIDDLFDDPHLRAVGFWQELEHPTEGRLRTTAPPIEFSATPARVRRLAPRLGEHTREVLLEAGFSDAELAALEAEGVTLS
ncbi:MAG: CoA transferase [Vicinamibacteraceae bacterium]|nr:CoA transferase [Vicinamibacteraceae bacterium]